MSYMTNNVTLSSGRTLGARPLPLHGTDFAASSSADDRFLETAVVMAMTPIGVAVIAGGGYLLYRLFKK